MKFEKFSVLSLYLCSSLGFAQEVEPFNVPESDQAPASDEQLIQEDSGQTGGAEAKKTPKSGSASSAATAVKNASPAPNSETTPPVIEASINPADGAISDGSLVKIEGKGFAINPPVGWQVNPSQPGISLLLKVPFQPGLKYQRNIQVMVFSGPKYIDQETGVEFSDSIVKNYSQFVPGISDYKFRNFDDVTMNDGRHGLLFYTEFKLNELPMMQALVLLSGKDNHYLVIYTDVAENFGEKEGSSQKFLTESWTSMTSIAIDTPSPERPNIIPLIAGIIIGILLLGVTFAIARRIRSSRLYDSFDDNVDTNPPTDPRTKETLNQHSMMSQMQDNKQNPDQPLSSLSKYDSVFLPSKLDGKKHSEDDDL